MNNEEKILNLQEENRELKNQLVMKSNKIKELECALEQHNPNRENGKEKKAYKLVKAILDLESSETLRETLDHLLTSFMCFDPLADDRKERNDTVFCVNTFKHFLTELANLERELEPKE